WTARVAFIFPGIGRRWNWYERAASLMSLRTGPLAWRGIEMRALPVRCRNRRVRRRARLIRSNALRASRQLFTSHLCLAQRRRTTGTRAGSRTWNIQPRVAIETWLTQVDDRHRGAMPHGPARSSLSSDGEAAG